jgi:CheY-like chemotaxis protein
MDSTLMGISAPTEAADSDAIDGNSLLRRRASTHDTVSKAVGNRAGRRVLRVLVVADELDTANGFTKQVRRWGHAARMAGDSRAAVRATADKYPDVVLLELGSPLLDGCRIARQLRFDSSTKDSFIIAVTAEADDECRRHCIQAGIDLLLIKPVDPSVLETLLLLECVRVNRSRTDNTASLAASGSSQLASNNSAADEWDGAAETACSGLVGSASGQQP